VAGSRLASPWTAAGSLLSILEPDGWVALFDATLPSRRVSGVESWELEQIGL
jgi:hypothetical protein